MRKDKRASLLAALAGLILVALPAVTQQPVTTDADILEQGKFTLHKFEQAIGEETYEIRRDGQSVVVKIDFKFTDRGSPVPLTTTFRATQDLTPQAFEIKGRTARPISIDEAVTIESGTVHLRTRGRESDTTAPPGPFFTIAGYAPTTMQMLMVRYWATHGSPSPLATLPSGSVKVEARGQDTIHVGAKDEKLDRYTIEGLIWGRETLWFDANRNLVAAITTDAEFDHFEAIRDGYESALGDFVGLAGVDGMRALAEISKGIPGSHSSTLAIVGATLIDGTGAAPVPDAAVVIKDGRITAAGPRSKVKIPRHAKTFDAQGKTILPGLWDMHAHFEQVEWGPIYLAAGVTTVRDCGNEFEFITAVRDAIAQGRGLGPRLLLAGIVDGSGLLPLGVAHVDTPEQARMWVGRYHAAWFQQMKIYSSVKLEEIKAVADEAHRLGMTVTGHIPEGLTAYQAIAAGQDQINHIGYVADIMHAPLPATAKRAERRNAVLNIDFNSSEAQKALAFLKDHHTVVDPTMSLFELFTATTAKPPASFEPGIHKIPIELAEQLTDVEPPNENTEISEKVFQKELAIVGALHRAEIPVVAGTDQSVPGHSLHREIELYVQAGFTPMEAIQAATIVPARVMGLDKELGTIEKGKRGDLILINGNPLEDIHNTRNVEYVITNGTMYHAAELWQAVGFKP
ncbi:MAG TPA: amidohydrolase family protein [Candidatus Dormibacteraeota bacterium]|nr:amidohydrolase family protein [Candidatus Dormibacteraeota bacterium]